jgi:hypothetical protein
MGKKQEDPGYKKKRVSNESTHAHTIRHVALELLL